MTTETVEKTPNPARKRGLLIFAGLVLVVALGFAAWLWTTRNTLSTQDAYVNADVVQVSVATEGVLSAWHVHAGQMVPRGMVVAEQDAADARLNLAQAEANLSKAVRDARGLGSTALAAQSGVAQATANIATEQARAHSAQAELNQAQTMLRRQEGLASQGFVAREILTEAQAAVQNALGARDAANKSVLAAQAMLEQAKAQRDGALAQVDGSALSSLPDVLAAITGVRMAQLALERTKLYAPLEGIATNHSASLGQRVMPGANVLGIVPLESVWVDANFKETALSRLRVGQPVRLTADVYGSKVVYQGKVAGIEPATGTALSLLPAQNASGNWIKVVQRVPVRIWLDAAQLAPHPLQMGLSMQVEVDVSDQSGSRLGLLPEAATSMQSDVFAKTVAQAETEAAKIITQLLASASLAEKK